MPNATTSILIIDDDIRIARVLYQLLTHEGYSVNVAHTAEEGIASAVNYPPQLVLLDLILPDGNGHDVCRELRRWLDVPIIILSVRMTDREKVLALDEGADDYLTKPFSSIELCARVRAQLRRYTPPQAASPILCCGDLIIDQARREVSRAGLLIPLTPTEYHVLCYLALHADRVVTQHQLLAALQATGDSIPLRSYISHLRRKLALETGVVPYIKTEYGVGFRLVTDEPMALSSHTPIHK
jgi:two-component system KDP operon response regulator KdpE